MFNTLPNPYTTCMESKDITATVEAIRTHGQITFSFATKPEAKAFAAKLRIECERAWVSLKSLDVWQSEDGDWLVGTDTYG